MPNLLTLDSIHISHWQKLKTIIANDRLAQALLFVGPSSAHIEKMINYLITSRLCTRNTGEPCFQCSNCLMMTSNEHPDLLIIQPEKSGSAIKIDQIRDLQAEIYQTPQCGKGRFVFIKSAENMNKASANALLKILEEPPDHAHFILLAAQLATLPATILSRCQLWRVNPEIKDNLCVLELSANGDPEILIQRDLVLKDLLALVKGQSIPSILAANWKAIAPKELLWLLYLINAQILMIDTLSQANLKVYLPFIELAQRIAPKEIFHQLDKINALQKKISHNIHVNIVLAIEDLLMDLCQGETYA